jgi:hypothetical protein
MLLSIYENRKFTFPRFSVLETCIGLFSTVEDASVDRFRQADLNEAAVRRTRSRALGERLR